MILTYLAPWIARELMKKKMREGECVRKKRENINGEEREGWTVDQKKKGTRGNKIKREKEGIKKAV